MLYLASSGWWMFAIVAIIGLVGLVVFLLRKHIPGLVEYENEDEEKIAEDNLNRVLMTLEEEDKINKGADLEEVDDDNE